MSSVISDRHFHDEHAAYAYVEERVWPNGQFAPIAVMPIRHASTSCKAKSTRIKRSPVQRMPLKPTSP